MNTKKLVITLMTVFSLSLASVGYAADAGIQFGIADDLIVNGVEGVALTPDVAIKGFTVFGSTQSSYPGGLGASAGPGNVVINASLSVSSGEYIVGGSTIAGGAYFVDSSTFASTINLSTPTSIYIQGGALDQVLKKDASGSMKWGTDLTGTVLAGTLNRLQLVRPAGTLANSVFMQNADDTNITMISGSSLTINGPFESTGTVKLGNLTAGLGDVTIVGAATVGGTLGVTGAATLSDNLTVLGISRLGNTPGTDYVGINDNGEVATALKVVGIKETDKYVAKFYSGDVLAAWIVKK